MKANYIAEELPASQEKRAAVMIGRLSPPTRGHFKVIDAMKTFIRAHPELKLSVPIIVIVAGEKSSQDKDKNPLTADDRVKFIKASGRANGVTVLTAPSGFAAFKEVRKAGYEPIAIAAGSDRAEGYLKLLDKYFTAPDGSKIKHVLIPGLEREGQGDVKTSAKAIDKALANLRKGDELDVAEVSGSMARRAVELGFEPEFAQIVGLEKKPKLAKLMFNKIKASLGESNGAA